jgi:hypothetical protein
MRDAGTIEALGEGPLVFLYSNEESGRASLGSEGESRDGVTRSQSTNSSPEKRKMKAKVDVRRSVSDLLSRRAAEGIQKRQAHSTSPHALTLRLADPSMSRLQVIEVELGQERARALRAAAEANTDALEEEGEKVEVILEAAAAPALERAPGDPASCVAMSGEEVEMEFLRNYSSTDTESLHALQSESVSSQYLLTNCTVENDGPAGAGVHHRQLSEVNSSIASFTQKLRAYRDNELRGCSDASELQDALDACNDVLQEKEDSISLLRYQQVQYRAHSAALSSKASYFECELLSTRSRCHMERQALLVELQAALQRSSATELSAAQQASDLCSVKQLWEIEQKKFVEQTDLIAHLGTSITLYEAEAKVLRFDFTADKQAQATVISGLVECQSSLQRELKKAEEDVRAGQAEAKEMERCHADRLADVKFLLMSLTHELNESRASLDISAQTLLEVRGNLKDKGKIERSLLDIVEQGKETQAVVKNQHQADLQAQRSVTDSDDRTAKDTIAALAAKIEGLTASAETASTQLALRETSLKEETDALRAQVASLQLNLDLSKAAVAQTQSAAELELHKVRSLSAAAEAAVRTELAVLSATHGSLTAQLQKAEAQAAGDMAKAEDHAATLSGKIDGLQAEVHSGREVTAALMCGMQCRLDAAHAEASTSESEKQQLLAAHSEKLGDMKSLVTTFTERLKEAREKEVTHTASAAEMHGVAVESNLKFEEKCVEMMAMKSELDALESSVSQERYARLTELQAFIESVAADQSAMRTLMTALQAKYDALQGTHELHKTKASEEEARGRDEVAALQQINYDLRSETVSQIDSAYARLQTELSLLASTDAVRRAELTRSAESIGALCDDKRQLGVELANALSAKLSAESALANFTVLASDEEAHFRAQIVTLSSQIIDLTSGLASQIWQSAAEEQLARDRIKEMEKEKQNLSLDLHKARAHAAIEHSQLSIKLFVLTSKHDGLAVELESERSFKRSIAAIEERHVFTIEQMNGKMVADEELTRLTMGSMQDKLDAAHAEASTSESEKQQLLAAHSEKLGDMKSLVTTFTKRLKEAREKEVTHTAEAHDQSCRVISISEELSDLRSRYHTLESASEAETARAQAAADSEDRTAKDTIAALAAKIEGLTASAETASTQLALRETSLKEETDALHAQVASLQLNLDLSKAAVAQTQSAAELVLQKVQAFLTLLLENAIVKGDRCEVNVGELEVLIAAHQAAIASMGRHDILQSTSYSDESSLHPQDSTQTSMGSDEERNRLLMAEFFRIRSLNEELIAEIAAEEEKGNGLRNSDEDFTFVNPMMRSSGAAAGMKKKTADPIGIVKRGKLDRAVEVATAADALRAEEEGKGKALAKQIAEVLEDNAAKAFDLVAALNHRDLLIEAITAEEELSFILQDRAADAMEERSLRCVVALEEERALELLIEASKESRDRFEAAAAMFEIEKERAEEAERARLQISDAIASAVRQNALLSASLSLEGQKTVELESSVAQAVHARSPVASYPQGDAAALTISMEGIRANSAEMKSHSASAALSPMSGSATPRRWGKEFNWHQGDKTPADMDGNSKSPIMTMTATSPKDSPRPASAMTGREGLRSSLESPRLTRMDVIPAEQKGLSRGSKAAEPRVISSMENEAKTAADKMHNKRNAIRNAVNQALDPSQHLLIDRIDQSSVSSALDDTRLTDASQDYDDQCIQSPCRISTKDVVSLCSIL